MVWCGRLTDYLAAIVIEFKVLSADSLQPTIPYRWPIYRIGSAYANVQKSTMIVKEETDSRSFSLFSIQAQSCILRTYPMPSHTCWRLWDHDCQPGQLTYYTSVFFLEYYCMVGYAWELLVNWSCEKVHRLVNCAIRYMKESLLHFYSANPGLDGPALLSSRQKSHADIAQKRPTNRHRRWWQNVLNPTWSLRRRQDEQVYRMMEIGNLK